MNFTKFNFTTTNASNTCATTGCNTAPYDGGGIYCYYCRVKMGMPVWNWSLTISQLAIFFEGRLDKYLEV